MENTYSELTIDFITTFFFLFKNAKKDAKDTVVRSAVFTGHLVYACVIVALISRSDNSLIMRRELTSIH